MDFDYSFEQAVERLEEIGALLAQGSETLENSVLLYQEAGELIQYAQSLLKQAALKVERIALSVQEEEK